MRPIGWSHARWRENRSVARAGGDGDGDGDSVWVSISAHSE